MCIYCTTLYTSPRFARFCFVLTRCNGAGAKAHFSLLR